MLYVEAPNELNKDNHLSPLVFLAGGISQCKNWQSDLTKELVDCNCVIINPRRENYIIGDEKMNLEQIEWEYKYLRLSHIFVFYFCEETLCPITLFEYGGVLERLSVWRSCLDNVIVYAEPNYPRKNDLIIQSRLARKHVHTNYLEFVNSIKSRIQNFS